MKGFGTKFYFTKYLSGTVYLQSQMIYTHNVQETIVDRIRLIFIVVSMV